MVPDGTVALTRPPPAFWRAVTVSPRIWSDWKLPLSMATMNSPALMGAAAGWLSDL